MYHDQPPDLLIYFDQIRVIVPMDNRIESYNDFLFYSIWFYPGPGFFTAKKSDENKRFIYLQRAL